VGAEGGVEVRHFKRRRTRTRGGGSAHTYTKSSTFQVRRKENARRLEATETDIQDTGKKEGIWPAIVVRWARSKRGLQVSQYLDGTQLKPFIFHCHYHTNIN
jgi:hypothetical protein